MLRRIPSAAMTSGYREVPMSYGLVSETVGAVMHGRVGGVYVV